MIVFIHYVEFIHYTDITISSSYSMSSVWDHCRPVYVLMCCWLVSDLISLWYLFIRLKLKTAKCKSVKKRFGQNIPARSKLFFKYWWLCILLWICYATHLICKISCDAEFKLLLISNSYEISLSKWWFGKSTNGKRCHLQTVNINDLILLFLRLQSKNQGRKNQ